ncbi:MAG: M1 family metallopeptidase, partial [Bacteroidales bacterium]
VPRTVARTGVLGDFYFIAQWFPKIGVLEDDGWNCHQFHATTEFFADYGVYDVSIAVPTGWTVGATGRERERRDNAGGTTTHRYYQEDVHDFAWTTSPDYLVRTERFEQRGLPSVEMRLLLQPEHASQASRHFAATRAALGSYGEWFGPYPYDHITIVDPAWQSDAGGMEYPTLFTAGTRWLAPGGVTEPELVTVHECGHQFWYALVGNNEFEDAWLDEGLNTYSTARVLERVYGGQNHVSRRYFGGFIPRVFPEIPVRRVDDDGLDSYREGARLDVPSVPSWKYWPIAAGSLSYSKTALWLHTLERFLGWPTFRRCLATYFDRWKFRHPKPADFFQAINEVSGKDLTWFFDQVYRSTCVFDYGVDSVRDGGTSAGSGRSSRSTVVVRRYADGVFPVDVLVRFADGSQVREHWDGRDAWKAFKYERRAGVVSAIVDPDRVLALDVNETNNSRSVNAPSGSASNKWAAAWMVWLQDLLLSYGFFV